MRELVDAILGRGIPPGYIECAEAGDRTSPDISQEDYLQFLEETRQHVRLQLGTYAVESEE